LWILFGLAIVAVPIACSSSSSPNDGGNTDVAQHPDGMTKT
jgi:hypothetical protein